MSDIKNKRYYLDNEQGKILYEKTILQYSKLIVDEIKKNPKRISELLIGLGVTKEEFYALISGEKRGNITFYDESLKLLKKIR